MRHRYRGLTVTAGVMATVAAGGGLTAWASWSAEGSSATTTARSGRVPVLDPPRAEISGKTPKIGWIAVRLSAAVPVDQYVLIRIDGSARAEVCRTTTLSCHDADAPAGSTLTYLVHATKGGRWVGVDSKPSNPVVTPGAKKAPAQAHGLSGLAADQGATTDSSAGTASATNGSPSQTTDPATEDTAGSETVTAEESTPEKSADPSMSPPPADSVDVEPVPGADQKLTGPDKQ